MSAKSGSDHFVETGQQWAGSEDRTLLGQIMFAIHQGDAA